MDSNFWPHSQTNTVESLLLGYQQQIIEQSFVVSKALKVGCLRAPSELTKNSGRKMKITKAKLPFKRRYRYWGRVQSLWHMLYKYKNATIIRILQL